MSSVVSDMQFACRMLRMSQLLCEGHNSWWQLELHDQKNCTQKVDLVHTICSIFSHHAGELQVKLPSSSKLKSLANTDPRLQQALASLNLRAIPPPRAASCHD